MTPAVDTPATPWIEAVPELAALGVRAFTTTRAAGSFATAGDEPVGTVMARWRRLQLDLASAAPRLATAMQVHGAEILVHDGSWTGWLRGPEADGHFVPARGTAVAVSVADCVPVFIAHPAGAVALLHSGWRGTAARIVARAVRRFEACGLDAGDLVLHAGPAICGRCYEVSREVYAEITGEPSSGPAPHVDLRAVIAAQAAAAGVRRIGASDRCTRCDNDCFFSHRAGDAGRQLAVIVAPI